MRNLKYLAMVVVCAMSLMLHCRSIDAAPFNVLVVMSYEKNYPWVAEIREGIESVLKDRVRLHYFHLDTKTKWHMGSRRAQEAYAYFRSLKPDGVIAVDDDAQSMFVVPYLKDRHDTPVIFCGVNADPSVYGYPSKNVTGVLEREPMKQSLLFLTQLDPSIKTIGFICKESPTARAVERQLSMEKSDYPIEYIGSQVAHSLQEAVRQVRDFKARCDALIYITMEGLPDQHGKPLTDQEILPVLAQTFGKPVITNALYRAKYGALSAVVKTGQEHGTMAAEMLLKAMRGMPVKELPITQNRFGLRIINVDTMVALGIQPKALLLRSATLIRNEGGALPLTQAFPAGE